MITKDDHFQILLCLPQAEYLTLKMSFLSWALSPNRKSNFENIQCRSITEMDLFERLRRAQNAKSYSSGECFLFLKCFELFEIFEGQFEFARESKNKSAFNNLIEDKRGSRRVKLRHTFLRSSLWHINYSIGILNNELLSFSPEHNNSLNDYYEDFSAPGIIHHQNWHGTKKLREDYWSLIRIWANKWESALLMPS